MKVSPKNTHQLPISSQKSLILGTPHKSCSFIAGPACLLSWIQPTLFQMERPHAQSQEIHFPAIRAHNSSVPLHFTHSPTPLPSGTLTPNGYQSVLSILLKLSILGLCPVFPLQARFFWLQRIWKQKFW